MATRPLVAKVWAPVALAHEHNPLFGIFDEVALEYQDRIQFAQINYSEELWGEQFQDEEEEDYSSPLVKKYKLLQVPTFLVFSKGELVESFSDSAIFFDSAYTEETKKKIRKTLDSLL